MAAWLTYNLRDIVVSVGSFLIGRGVECDLALEDPLISRRHARIRLDAGCAILEDLASRNGVYLNGVRLDKPEILRDGDQIRVGSQDFGYHEASDLTAPDLPIAARSTMADVSVADLRKQIEADETSERAGIATSPVSPVAGKQTSGLAIIGSVADKALALGRADEAERILQRALHDLLARAKRGELDPELGEGAASYAIRLAGSTSRGAWVDYVFELYTALRVLMPARLVDELYAVLRKVKHTDKGVLRAYTVRLREISSGFGPTERFIQQRIEGFERWAP
jgi:hypothetical protein